MLTPNQAAGPPRTQSTANDCRAPRICLRWGRSIRRLTTSYVFGLIAPALVRCVAHQDAHGYSSVIYNFSQLVERKKNAVNIDLAIQRISGQPNLDVWSILMTRNSTAKVGVRRSVACEWVGDIHQVITRIRGQVIK